MQKVHLPFIAALALLSVSAIAEINIIGRTRSGTEVTKSLTKSQYKKYFKRSLEISSEVAESKMMYNSDLTLKRISVGLSVSGEIGIGPWALGGGICQKFYFERR